MAFYRDQPFESEPQGLLSWDFGGARVLTLMPAGHRPGYYKLQVNLFITTAGAGGNVNGSSFAWSEPVFGPTSLVFGNVAITATGLVFTVSRDVLSRGDAPITYTITPASVSGSPLGNLIGNALFNSRSVL